MASFLTFPLVVKIQQREEFFPLLRRRASDSDAVRLSVHLVLVSRARVKVPLVPLHRVPRADAQNLAIHRVKVREWVDNVEKLHKIACQECVDDCPVPYFFPEVQVNEQNDNSHHCYGKAIIQRGVVGNPKEPSLYLRKSSDGRKTRIPAIPQQFVSIAGKTLAARYGHCTKNSARSYPRFSLLYFSIFYHHARDSCLINKKITQSRSPAP